jgi:plasmid stability protein
VRATGKHRAAPRSHADSVGYGTFADFNRQFKRLTSMTPRRKYRARLRRGAEDDHVAPQNRQEGRNSFPSAVHRTLGWRGAAVAPTVIASSVSGVRLDMRPACEHAHYMSKMVRIRNVPDALHRKLKSRAAASGQTLSDFLLAELERLAARPTRDEMLTRVHGPKRVTLKTPAAVVIREERESA